MSQVARDLFRKRLSGLLSIADNEAFCIMLWAVDALQTGRSTAAEGWLQFPADAATEDFGHPAVIYRWELETLVNQLFLVPKDTTMKRTLRCDLFQSAALVVKYLRKFEDAEASLYLNDFGIFSEMHRIGHRQFHWQRGYLNHSQFYRAAFIYGQGECAAYFEREFGLTMNEFSLIGFGIYGALMARPWIDRSQTAIPELGLSRETVEKALRLLMLPVRSAAEEVRDMIGRMQAGRRPPPAAFQPNLLRRFPILGFGPGEQRLVAPIPEVMLIRITSGIYYDLAGGPAELRNEASKRFEEYSARFLRVSLPRFSVSQSVKYHIPGQGEIESPDILALDGPRLALIVECKATKLTIGAQFSDNPIEAHKRGFDEIAKGVFQLWRYFSHCRRGIADAPVDRQTAGMVLTLEPWFHLSRELQDYVLKAATERANSDPDILEEDRRAVIFGSINDLESTLAYTDEDEFLSVLASASEEKFMGWLLPNVRQLTRGEPRQKKRFPFDLNDVLPWHSDVGRIKLQRGGDQNLHLHLLRVKDEQDTFGAP